jgi:hypothetical protein
VLTTSSISQRRPAKRKSGHVANVGGIRSRVAYQAKVDGGREQAAELMTMALQLEIQVLMPMSVLARSVVPLDDSLLTSSALPVRPLRHIRSHSQRKPNSTLGSILKPFICAINNEIWQPLPSGLWPQPRARYPPGSETRLANCLESFQPHSLKQMLSNDVPAQSSDSDGSFYTAPEPKVHNYSLAVEP